MSSKRVLLIQPPMVEEGADVIYPSLPVLGAALASVGHNTEYLNLNLEYIVYEKSACLTACKALSPDEIQSILNANGATIESTRLAFWASCFVSLAQQLDSRISVSENGQVLVDRSVSCEALFQRVWKVYAAGLCPQVTLDPLTHGIYELEGGLRFRSFLSNSRILGIDEELSFIGITVPMVDNIGYALLLAEWLKDKYPWLTIVMGGTSFSAIPSAILEGIRCLPYVDLVVEGTGETAVLAVALGDTVPVIFNRQSFTTVVDGRIQLLSRRPKVRGILNTPSVTYPQPKNAIGLKGEIAILQSRGCYWGECVYCTYPELYSANEYNERPIDHILDEIERHVAIGYRRFRLTNDTLRKGYALDLARGIIARGLDIQWRSFMRAEPFSYDALALMRDSGGYGFIVGLETVVDRLLSLVKKGVTHRTTEQLFELLEKAGLMVEVNVIPDLPTTTYSEALETLEFVELFRGVISRLNVSTFVVPVGSPMSKIPETYGIQLTPYEPKNVLDSTLLPFVRISGASTEELKPIRSRLLGLSSRIRSAEIERATHSNQPVSNQPESQFSWRAPANVVFPYSESHKTEQQYISVTYNAATGSFSSSNDGI